MEGAMLRFAHYYLILCIQSHLLSIYSRSTLFVSQKRGRHVQIGFWTLVQSLAPVRSHSPPETYTL
jgi:hypothetical protein